MNKILQPKYKKEICDNCKNSFLRRWTNNVGDYTKVNLVSHWTGDENISWNEKKILCSPCLIKWFKEDKSEFKSLVPQNRYRTFQNYIYSGLIKEYKE